MKYFQPISWQDINEIQQTTIDDKLRHRLIVGFINDNRNRLTDIKNALGGDDIRLAHRLVHSLKSNAGHLGKDLLQKAAADVEHQLKDGQNTVSKQQLAELEAKLNEAFAELAAELATYAGANSPDDGAAVEPLDAKSVRCLIEQLEPMLTMGNFACRDHIPSLRRIPGTAQLIQQVENLDFQDALGSLATIKKNVGIG